MQPLGHECPAEACRNQGLAMLTLIAGSDAARGLTKERRSGISNLSATFRGSAALQVEGIHASRAERCAGRFALPGKAISRRPWHGGPGNAAENRPGSLVGPEGEAIS